MNFFFLSKLLPLFLYPLGLSCFLLLLSLVCWWFAPRWMPLPILLALIILLTASNADVSNLLVRSLEHQNIPQGELPSADAIVLLGGATKPAIPPRPMVDVNEQGDRVLYAAKLYLDKKAPLIIASGGRIDWEGGTAESSRVSEAADMAQLLILMGVPKEAIIEEPTSLNTYENAINVQKILQEKGINQILLVTSALHMPRSLAIFQRLGIKAIAAPTDFFISEEDEKLTSAFFEILPDADRLAISTKAIKEYIGLIVYRLKGWA